MRQTTAMVYHPNNPDLRANPWPTYQWLRDEQPLYHNPGAGFWVLSRHADVSAAWRDPALYSSDHGPALEHWAPDASATMGFVAMDPPQHTLHRRLISQGFTPGRVRHLEPRIRQLTRAYLQPLLEEGSLDFADFATAIPVDVISELIGVPVADRPLLLQLSRQIMTRDDANGRLTPAVRQANAELASYYASLIAERRARPREDLTSALLRADIDGERLAERDVIATLMLLGVAGNDTTAKLLTTAWRCAWQHPDQRARLWSGELDVGCWVEETLRYEGPSAYTARRLTRPTELHGVVVPAGACVLLVIAAANRDERVFPAADRYDLSRDTSRTLAFGLGQHFCLGASLARLEATVVLQELVRAVEADYEVDLAAASWAVSPNVRGHATLPTTVKRR
ncbi:putative cytochrome P450 hydroxylase [[Actinomadura] parvosata subsp. kistnae]|uniref:Cytochrome n=1 Tax=[Actinomadura] parvosata subsp. kistnae TaxID=1909395 RepID=A0A1U9ZYM4_9ACTN|nr:cytochrome P450 [Nonomuraea sp. ATCC 55076]AQZ63052.1 cytochrome [Nonomuraea sp. ATCC 55076]SPL98673.1 putative cytochrome P450 hydroxylase [Actinomadura parvosata subsp. kistnae]